jgi:hypothetical protein
MTPEEIQLKIKKYANKKKGYEFLLKQLREKLDGVVSIAKDRGFYDNIKDSLKEESDERPTGDEK